MTARLQVMHLPPAAGGDTGMFALVADQAGDLPAPDLDALRTFAAELGAQGCLVVSETVTVVQGDTDADADEQSVEMVAEGLRQQFASLAAPPAPPAKRLPSASTTEGKMARMWRAPQPVEDAEETRNG